MVASLLSDDWRALFEAGTAHIVGVVAADGSPFATRGWGARFSSSDALEGAGDRHLGPCAHG